MAEEKWADPAVQLNTKNLARANRFEHHLARLVENWPSCWPPPMGYVWHRDYNDEIEAAEKSLKELGVKR